ncbi:hypothetical protein ACLB6G_11395 [Zhengella sp. ZM62]|uniref:hypothetical protein n=1 Tax=Zhengella sedimenti TaxID=3390035 RepID=UPI003976DDC6
MEPIDFPGLIVEHRRTSNFIVKPAPEKHAGLGRVLINYQRRDNAKRFQIVRIVSENGRQAYAAAIGHYDDPSYIKMDHDLRVALNLNIDDNVQLEITKTGIIGSYIWYIMARDPAIRIPAILASISVILGVLSIYLSMT